MKMHGLAIFAVLGVSAATGGVPSSRSGEAAVIERARLQQNAAIVRHDLPAIASYWTEDVTICRGLGFQVAGKANYLALFESDVPGSKDLVVYQRKPDAIEVSSSWPLAFESGVWQGHAGAADGPVVIEGRYSAQWVKRADRWLIRSEVFVALRGAGPGLALQAAP